LPTKIFWASGVYRKSTKLCACSGSLASLVAATGFSIRIVWSGTM
jgi:hypothetical protein